MRKGRSFSKQVFIAALLMLVLGGAVAFTQNGKIAEFFWTHNYKTAAYYLNYSNGQLALQEAQYYFAGGAYDLKKAKKAYLLALRLNPSTPLVHYQLSRIYFVQGDFKTALDEINTELVTNPQNLRALYVRGLIELYQLDLLRAENDFKRFTLWAPTEWGGYNDLAYVQAKEGKYKESEQTIQLAMQKVPKAETNPWLWNSLGLAQLNQLKYEKAAASFQKALDLAKQLTNERWRRAYSANDPAGDTDSIEAFRKAIENNLKAAEAGE